MAIAASSARNGRGSESEPMTMSPIAEDQEKEAAALGAGETMKSEAVAGTEAATAETTEATGAVAAATMLDAWIPDRAYNGR